MRYQKAFSGWHDKTIHVFFPCEPYAVCQLYISNYPKGWFDECLLTSIGWKFTLANCRWETSPTPSIFNMSFWNRKAYWFNKQYPRNFIPKTVWKTPPSGILARVNCPWIFGVLDGIFRKLPSLFCDVVLKIYDSWNTSGSWKHAHYGGSQLRSEQTKKMTQKLWNVVMWIVICFLLFFFWGLGQGCS